MNVWLTILLFTDGFLLLFVLADLLYRNNILKADHTRNIVHAGAGLIALLFPFYFDEVLSVAILCAGFLLLLFLTKRLGLLGAVNGVERHTYGSILYPIIVFLVFLFYVYKSERSVTGIDTRMFYCLPIAIMALCDPVAAVVGNYFKRTRSADKSLNGSLAFFIIAVTISIFSWELATRFTPRRDILILSLIIAVSCTVAEYFSKKGWDNFTVPVAAMIILSGVS